ncbi:hypothetical protein ACFVJH_28390 [Streptomyces decoyicus]|uniref:hypothetical protein n=1 Tax=Streptomyces decoyicus TaxID=249567 RepID=UPI00362CE9B4
MRFETLLSRGRPPSGRAGAPGDCGRPRACAYESWTADLDRVVVALSRQSVAFADNPLGRWLSRFKPAELDGNGDAPPP